MTAALQSPAGSPLVAVSDLWVAYGRIEALRGINLTVGRGEVVAVVGANGAGKTTLLRTLCGLVRPKEGQAHVCGQDARLASPHKLAAGGLLHVPEGRGTLQTLSVRDNLRIAYDIRPSKRSFEQALAAVYQRFPHLETKQAQLAGNLSGGEQQMLGLSPLMVSSAYRTLRALKDEGLTILLVEQNVKLALRFADRAYVLRQGRVVREGRSEELLHDPDFTAHYLGTH
jgi:branched-chain amino acid transport system ATP-binding protein